MAEKNPIVRSVKNSRATVVELIEAKEYLDQILPDEIAETLGTKKEAKLVHIAETIDEAKQMAGGPGEITGLRTGYDSLDVMTGGLREGDIIVVFGDTMHGKSLLVQNIAINVADKGKPVLFISTELTNTDNTDRFLTMLRSEERVAGMPIIYPAETPSYKDVDGLIEAAKEVELVVIDLLHNFDSDGENEAVSLSNMCKAFKKAAVRNKVPIILVSHINEDKYRTGVPDLRDLKGSSSIKQIASFAFAIYNPDKDPNRKHDFDLNILKVVLRKWRRGNPKQRLVELDILENANLAEKITRAGFNEIS